MFCIKCFKRAIKIIVLCQLVWVNTYAADTTLRSLTMKSTPSNWQITLNVSGNKPPSYHYFMLANPDRLVIDLNHTRSMINLSQYNWQETPLYRIRTATRDQDGLRLVMDLRSPLRVQINSQATSRQQQLVVSLQGPAVTALATKPQATNDKLEFDASNTVHRSPDVIVVIDPGHGGKDPGATGVRGTHEKTVVLSISKKLYRMINQQPGFKAYLTRDTDVYLSLRQRLAIARKHKADMFVAIHADAFSNTTAKGASVFALSSKGATSEAARWLAERENQSELIGGVDLTDKTHMLQSVLISLSQTATIRSSIEIGNVIISSLKTFAHLHDDDVDQAAFVVLKSPDIPSLLIETGFLSNPQEEQRLRTQSYQNKIAQSIKHGIVSYFQVQPPRGTALALQRQRRQNETWHTVSRGDTLSYIAFRYHVSTASLRQTNHLSSDVIRVGQQLRIPQQKTG